MQTTTATTLAPRRLGSSDLEVSPLGLGCWAIGGPFTMFGNPDGWGEVDDDESIAAIRRAVDLGVSFFDTADAYGTGRSEEVLGRALADQRDDVVIATKFGFTHDAVRRDLTGTDTSADYIRSACEASLKRLGTDRIDLYQLHVPDLAITEALDVAAVLEELVTEGKIRSYGWSTDDVEAAREFSSSDHCVAVQHELNLFSDAGPMLALCDELHLVSINRTPLAMGLLTGKFRSGATLPADDVRATDAAWFSDGRPREDHLTRLAAAREVLCSDGRTLTQGALGWIWARSGRTVPIPGFRLVSQVEENAGALERGPLTPAQMDEVADLLG